MLSSYKIYSVFVQPHLHSHVAQTSLPLLLRGLDSCEPESKLRGIKRQYCNRYSAELVIIDETRRIGLVSPDQLPSRRGEAGCLGTGKFLTQAGLRSSSSELPKLCTHNLWRPRVAVDYLS
jgi:hypothetical protein